MNNILEVNNISKTYPKSDFALTDISFTVPYGSIMGIVGENGSGKTTTLGIILGLLRPNTGVVNIFGRPYSLDDIEMKAQIGVVFDSNYFPEGFSPKNIATIFRKVYKSWDDAYFLELLTKYEIGHKQKIKNMSHGTKSVLGIITALAQQPQLLILDEPTGGVDPVRREEVLDIFLDFVSDGERSIVFSSHITSDLEKIADHITIIHKGRLLETAEKDIFQYKYGIIRCGQESFDALCKSYKQEIVSFAKRDYQYRILIKDQSKIPDGNLMENPTLDEVMYLLTRGESP